MTAIIVFVLYQKPRKKTENATQEANSAAPMILGMILLEEANSLNIKELINELKEKWHFTFEDDSLDNQSIVLEINGYSVAIGQMPTAVPGNEVEEAVKYNYFWKNGEQEVSNHTGHIILSIMNAGQNPIQENILFSKVAYSIMNHSKAIGIYMGGRSLVINKAFYQSNVDEMTKDNLPLYIWLYFGLREENDKRSVYTYGLSEFGYKEMEILDSEHSLEGLSEMMYDLAYYVIAQNVKLNHGETIGMSETQKLKITESKGKYLEGNTLKIEY